LQFSDSVNVGGNELTDEHHGSSVASNVDENIVKMFLQPTNESNVRKKRLSVFNQRRGDALKVIEVQPLSKDAIREMVSDIFRSHGVRSENLPVDMIYDAASGNALYALELAKNAVDTSVDGKILTDKISVDLRSHRVEEVICHRFDQLDSTCQNILKVASVMCSNGASFNVAMLLFMYDDNNSMINAAVLPGIVYLKKVRKIRC
jgi:predicted ATPase